MQRKDVTNRIVSEIKFPRSRRKKIFTRVAVQRSTATEKNFLTTMILGILARNLDAHILGRPRNNLYRRRFIIGI